MNMRNIIKYSVFVLLAGIIFACRPHQYPHILVVADSLCEAKPDSAVSLLRSLKPQFASASKADRMYYQLLCIKAADKAYLPLPSDTTILSLIDYYENRRDNVRLPEVYFYAARIYSDKGDSPLALEYLQKGAEIISDSADGKLKTLIYYHMANLFVYQDLTDYAISSYQKALSSCKNDKDTMSMIYVLREAGFCYARKHKIDKELSCYKKAEALAESIGDVKMKYKIKAQIAACLKDKGKIDEAVSVIREVVCHDDPEERSSTYSIASIVFEEAGLHDSAMYYCRKMYEDGNVYAKRDASKMLANEALSKDDIRSAYKYVSTFDSLSDRIHQSDASASVAQMSALFDYRLREKQNIKLMLSNKNKTIAIITIVLVCILLVSLLCLLWVNKKRQLQVGLEKLRRLRDEEQAKSLDLIKKSRREIEKLRSDLETTDSENEALKQSLKEKEERLEHMEALAKMTKARHDAALSNLHATDIYYTITRLANEGSTMDESHWLKLDEAVSFSFPEFRKKLYALITPSSHEFHIVLLMKVKMSTVQIATLTARSKQAISTAKSRMYKKAFGKMGKTEEWDKVIGSL